MTQESEGIQTDETLFAAQLNRNRLLFSLDNNHILIATHSQVHVYAYNSIGTTSVNNKKLAVRAATSDQYPISFIDSGTENNFLDSTEDSTTLFQNNNIPNHETSLISCLTLSAAVQKFSIPKEKLSKEKLKSDNKFFINIKENPSLLDNPEQKDFFLKNILLENAMHGYVTGMAFHPINSLQLYVAYDVGILILWDFLDAVPLQCWYLATPISHIVTHPYHKNFIFLISPKLKLKSSDKKYQISCAYRVLQYDIKKHISTRLFKYKGIIRELKWMENGEQLTFFSGKTVFFISNIGLKNEQISIQSIDHNRSISSLCTPSFCENKTESSQNLAIGDVKGQIWLMSLSFVLSQVTNLFGGQELKYDDQSECDHKPVSTGLTVISKSLLHWHAHAVADISFSPDKNYLISGGEESVMVVWQIRSYTGANEAARKYLPRIGGHIVWVNTSPNGQCYSIQTNDNTIKLFRSYNYEKLGSISGLQCVGATLESLESRFISNCFSKKLKSGLSSLIGKSTEEDFLGPRSLFMSGVKNFVVTPGLPGFLQFTPLYSRTSFIKSSKTFDLCVCPQNIVSRKDNRSMIYFHVTKVAFSSNGLWMVTLDERNDVNYKEINLKFWYWDRNHLIWKKNGVVWSPHDLFAVTSVSVKPETTVDMKSKWESKVPYVLTTGMDGKIKIWVKSEWEGYESKKAKEMDRWVCKLEAFYRNNIPMGSTFSSDGTLLFILCDNPNSNSSGSSVKFTLTIWDPDTFSLIHVFSPMDVSPLFPLPQPKLNDFSHGENMHIYTYPQEKSVLILTSNELIQWCYINRTQRWSISLPDSISTGSAALPILLSIHPNQSYFVVAINCYSSSPLKGNSVESGKISRSVLLLFKGSTQIPCAVRHLEGTVTSVLFIENELSFEEDTDKVFRVLVCETSVEQGQIVKLIRFGETLSSSTVSLSEAISYDVGNKADAMVGGGSLFKLDPKDTDMKIQSDNLSTKNTEIQVTNNRYNKYCRSLWTEFSSHVLPNPNAMFMTEINSYVANSRTKTVDFANSIQLKQKNPFNQKHETSNKNRDILDHSCIPLSIKDSDKLINWTTDLFKTTLKL